MVWSNADERAAAASPQGVDLQCDACDEVYAEKVGTDRLEEVLEATRGLCQDCGCCHWLRDISAKAPTEVTLRPGSGFQWEAIVTDEDGVRVTLGSHRSFSAALAGLESWMQHGFDPPPEPEPVGL